MEEPSTETQTHSRWLEMAQLSGGILNQLILVRDLESWLVIFGTPSG